MSTVGESYFEKDARVTGSGNKGEGVAARTGRGACGGCVHALLSALMTPPVSGVVRGLVCGLSAGVRVRSVVLAVVLGLGCVLGWGGAVYGQTSTAIVNGVSTSTDGGGSGRSEVSSNTTGGGLPSLVPSYGGGGAGGGVAGGGGAIRLPDLTNRENFSPALQIIVLLTVLSLAPSILLMMTCFTRIIIVLGLLRQALGTQQLPPNQVLVGLALFMTFCVMTPTLSAINRDALQPYLNGTMSQAVALDKAVVPLRTFMQKQIEASGNEADVDLFMEFAKLPRAKRWSDVPTMSLIPAFILSELKTAFLIGFKVYLPFLVIDMVISTVLVSMGMTLLPPVLISLPFKLLLFVLVDGWHLIAGSLMGSFVV